MRCCRIMLRALAPCVGVAMCWSIPGCAPSHRSAPAAPMRPPGADLQALAGFDVVYWQARTTIRRRGTSWAESNWARLSTLTRYTLHHGAPPRFGRSAFVPRESLSDAQGTLARDGSGTWILTPRADAGSAQALTVARLGLQSAVLPPNKDKPWATDPSIRLSGWTRQADPHAPRGVDAWLCQVEQRGPGGSQWYVSQRQAAWTDKRTGRLVRKRFLQYLPESRIPYSETVYDAYAYDRRPPANTLDLAPAAGATVWLDSPDEPIGHMGAWNPSPADRTAVMRPIHASETAWTKGQFGAFERQWEFRDSAGWDDRFLGCAPSDTWRAWMARDEGTWLEMTSQPAGYYYASLYSRPGLRSLPPDPDAVFVVTTTTIRRRGCPYPLTAHLGYALRRRPDGWHIVDWSWHPRAPKEIIKASDSRP